MIDYVLSTEYCEEVNASRPNTALCRVWSAAGGIAAERKLQTNIEQSKAALSALECERSGISNRIRRPKSPEEQAQNKERRKAVSKQMKPVRERLHRAERILEKSPHLYELLKQEHELEKKARARYKERGR